MNRIEYIKMNKLEDVHFWFVAKRFFVESVLLNYRDKIKNILDIGSGTGGMTNYLQKYGDVIGIEKNNLALEISKRKKLNIKSGTASKLSFKDDSFDLVTIFDVLYHKDIPNEVKVLKEANRVLRKGGLVLITDSAYNFLHGPHDKATHGKKRYLLSEMSEMVKGAGFKIVKESYVFLSILPLVLIKRMLIDRLIKSNTSDVSPLPKFINNIMICILKIESYIIRFVNLKAGVSVLVLAKKI